MYKSQAKLFTPLGYLLQHLFCCSKHANAANGNPWKFLWIICNMGPCLFSSPSMVNLCHFPWKNPWKHPFSMGKIWENHDQNMIKNHRIFRFSRGFPLVFLAERRRARCVAARRRRRRVLASSKSKLEDSEHSWGKMTSWVLFHGFVS